MRALTLPMLLLASLIVACGGGSPTAPLTTPPPTHYFFKIGGTYRADSTSGSKGYVTLVVADVGTPDSVYGLGTLPDGTHFYIFAGRHWLPPVWLGTMTRDSGPDMQVQVGTIEQINLWVTTTFHGDTVWNQEFYAH